MPVRNEGLFMARSLRAAMDQDYPPARMEILVIDGMSTDDTRRTISAFGVDDERIKLLDNPGKIVSTGLNLALQLAKGEVIVRVDGHCEIAPDYVSRCVWHLHSSQAEGVGGPIETIGETKCASAIALAMSSTFGVGGAAFRTVKDRTILVDTVAFPAYTREAIQRGGPYDEQLVRNQDDEYNYRLRKLGGRILLASDIRSRYYSRGTMRSLWRQYFQYGYWKVRVLQKHPKQMRLRQFVPMVFVAAILVTLFAAILSTAGAWIFASLIISYVAANLLASILRAREGNWPLVPILPLAFAMLHFGYGCGFLVGLIRFCNRWSDRDQGIDSPLGLPAAVPGKPS
jgi:glycosyltransferase involved in cell wall biosynthesis